MLAVGLTPKVLSAWLLLLIVLLGVIGIVILLLLGGTWRRFIRRHRERRKARSMPDLWQAGGDRLSAHMDQNPDRPAKPS